MSVQISNGSNIFDLAKKASDEKIEKMREIAGKLFSGHDHFVIGVNGSIARREFTSGSDVDFFIINLAPSMDSNFLHEKRDRFSEELRKINLKMPALGGVFDDIQFASTILGKIGGDSDINKNLTQRMLLLLEGEWVFNEGGFKKLTAEAIDRYVHNDLPNGKICLYLLNDIIRYWRTICIDFEHKTYNSVNNSTKPRAIRLIKLRFSRMLMSFAGIVTVACAVDCDVDSKKKMIADLFSIPAIYRMRKILGDQFTAAERNYGFFLEKMDDSKIRGILESESGLDSEEFRCLNSKAKEFKKNLLNILMAHYGTESKIVESLLL